MFVFMTREREREHFVSFIFSKRRTKMIRWNNLEIAMNEQWMNKWLLLGFWTPFLFVSLDWLRRLSKKHIISSTPHFCFTYVYSIWKGANVFSGSPASSPPNVTSKSREGRLSTTTTEITFHPDIYTPRLAIHALMWRFLCNIWDNMFCFWFMSIREKK